VLVRPIVKSGLVRSWRDSTTVQFGLDPERAVVVHDVDPTAAALIGRLDGSRSLDAAIADGPDDPAQIRRAQALLDDLREVGVLDDAASSTSALASITQGERDRLTSELGSLSLLHRVPGSAQRIIDERRRQRVHVDVDERIGAVCALTLAASGVGAVEVVSHGDVGHSDPIPSGLHPGDVGRPRVDALVDRMKQFAPSGQYVPAAPRRTSRGTRRRPELTVVASRGPASRLRCAELVRAGRPHLVVEAYDTVGLVGPLVVPGTTPCLMCLDQHRADRDSGWALVLAQVADRDPRSSYPDVLSAAMATALGAMAAMHVLTWLGGGEPGSVGGHVELRLPDGRARRASWPAHHVCGCGSSG
jgi:bacteriocin biosynthesis cyclodehydratase domain-containing protein